jgi:uncharacterized coiled-coil DUF342 family protein
LILQDEIDRVTREIQNIERQFADSKVKMKDLAMGRARGRNTDAEYREVIDWRRRANYAKTALLEELRDLKDERKSANIDTVSIFAAARRNIRVQAEIVLRTFKGVRTPAKREALEALQKAVDEAARIGV